MSKTIMATVIVVILVVAGVGAYFLMKPRVVEQALRESGAYSETEKLKAGVS